MLEADIARTFKMLRTSREWTPEPERTEDVALRCAQGAPPVLYYLTTSSSMCLTFKVLTCANFSFVKCDTLSLQTELRFKGWEGGQGIPSRWTVKDYRSPPVAFLEIIGNLFRDVGSARIASKCIKHNVCILTSNNCRSIRSEFATNISSSN